MGNQPTVGVQDEPDILAHSYSLGNNYPNPFNPVTTIRYSLAQAGHVRLAVINLLGQEVGELVNTVKPSGEYQIQWNAKGMASGVYFYRLETRDFVQIRKMVLMK